MTSPEPGPSPSTPVPTPASTSPGFEPGDPPEIAPPTDLEEPPEPADPPPSSVPVRPPTDPITATRRLVGAAAGGDVDQVWEMLTAEARVALGGRQAVASRLTALHDRLRPVRDGAHLTTTTLETERGPVVVVVPDGASDGVRLALPFRDVGGRFHLAALDPPPDLRWEAPLDAGADLVVAGSRRPARVLVDGAEVSGVASGPGELRIPIAALSQGSHRAVAVFVVGDEITASAFTFTITAPSMPPPDGAEGGPDLLPEALPSSPRVAAPTS